MWASHWASSSLKVSSHFDSTSFCNVQSLPRFSQGRLPRRSSTRVRYEPDDAALYYYPEAYWNIITGIRSCKGQVQLRFRSLRSNPKPCIHLRRCPPQDLGPQRSRAGSVPPRSVPRRNLSNIGILLRFQHSKHYPLAARLVLQHVRARGEVRFQQADA